MRFERLILALGTLAAVSVDSAAMAIDPIDAISVCSRINKKDARLECYDQVAQDAASGRLQSTAPAQRPQPQLGGSDWARPPIGGAPAPSVQAPSAGFGAEALRNSDGSRQGGDSDSVQAQVASSTDNGLGQWRIRLADGAIWQMTERVGMFRPPAPNEVITIRKGAMGSFLMDVGKQGSVRVTRVR